MSDTAQFNPPAPYVFIASMDVTADKEALFNEVYDEEHVPCLLKVPGVRAVVRYENTPFSLAIGGELKAMDTSTEPKYHAWYYVDGPEVVSSDAWASAVEQGRWPAEVRPYTSNRRHRLMKLR